MGVAARRTAAGGTARLWRASDLAGFYGVDESTVHRWERSGRIRAARRDPGGTKYWVRSEVVEDALVRPTPPEPVPPTVDTLVASTRKRRRRR